jgi:hydrogenase maturation protease
MAVPEMPRTTVLGLGNMLMADDSIGLAALARLQDEWFVPPQVELVDGGTWGMNLLPIIEATDRLLVLDAIDQGREAGVVIQLEGNDVPRYLSTHLSPHQIDLREVLALAELRGTLPTTLVALGIQPARIELSTELSPDVAERLDDLVWLAARTLENWGVNCFPLGGRKSGLGVRDSSPAASRTPELPSAESSSAEVPSAE